MTWFDKTASALVHAIAAGHARDPLGPRAGVEDRIATFVGGQVDHMSAPLRRPMRLATCGLSLLALLSTGALFHRLPLDRRRRLVDRWRASPLVPIRDVVRFYESLTVFALFSEGAT